MNILKHKIEFDICDFTSELRLVAMMEYTPPATNSLSPHIVWNSKAVNGVMH